ncbi:hypothetical protein GmHk_01G001816 [Glycine max]|nr:hypothetical protein GmHk_01G001816 [Glycine max]
MLHCSAHSLHCLSIPSNQIVVCNFPLERESESGFCLFLSEAVVMFKTSDIRTKKKILHTVREGWRQFKFDLTSKWTLAVEKDSVNDTVRKMYGISKEKWAQFCQSRRDPIFINVAFLQGVRKKAQIFQKPDTAPRMMSRGGYEYLEKKLIDEKRKKKLEEAAQSRSIDTAIDPPSSIKQHVKWKLARTKKTGHMTSEAAKEIADKIDAFEEQASQGSFVTQLEDSFTEKSQFQSQMQSQGLTLPPEPEVGPLAAHVNTKESCVDHSGNDPDTEYPPYLVALGRVYEESTTVHNIPLLHDQVKVMWDVTLFSLFNEDFPLYIKHEDLLSRDLTNHNLNKKVTLRTGCKIQNRIAHWQMIVILPKENVVIWFCSLHNKRDNYLKGIINSALKELDDTQQSKSKPPARWIVVKYFIDPKPLEPERLKALRIQWAKYYLKLEMKLRMFRQFCNCSLYLLTLHFLQFMSQH